jgi:general secretion pathway protein G
MLITVVILGVLASVALPVVKHTSKRTQELELRQRLREIRHAIDEFRQDWARDGELLTGTLCVKNKLACKASTGIVGYPKTLTTLLGVELSGNEALQRDYIRRYLRRIPLDPTTGLADWNLRCYQDPPESETWCGEDVFDISSRSTEHALDASKYRDW